MMAWGLSEELLRQVANWDIPGFPGAAYNCVHFCDVEIARASACSRPPPPIINIFIPSRPKDYPKKGVYLVKLGYIIDNAPVVFEDISVP